MTVSVVYLWMSSLQTFYKLRCLDPWCSCVQRTISWAGRCFNLKKKNENIDEERKLTRSFFHWCSALSLPGTAYGEGVIGCLFITSLNEGYMCTVKFVLQQWTFSIVLGTTIPTNYMTILPKMSTFPTELNEGHRSVQVTSVCCELSQNFKGRPTHQITEEFVTLRFEPRLLNWPAVVNRDNSTKPTVRTWNLTIKASRSISNYTRFTFLCATSFLCVFQCLLDV